MCLVMLQLNTKHLTKLDDKILNSKSQLVSLFIINFVGLKEGKWI